MLVVTKITKKLTEQFLFFSGIVSTHHVISMSAITHKQHLLSHSPFPQANFHNSKLCVNDA